MSNLKQVGEIYNNLRDKLDDNFSQIKQSLKQRQGIKQLLSERKQLRLQLKNFADGLTPEQYQAYKDYRKIRRQIKHSQFQKKCDHVERKIFKKVNPAYIYMIPAAIGAVFFTLLPCLFMIVGSFFKLDLVNLSQSKFVDIWNYQMIFLRDKEFLRSIGNTVIFAVLTVFLLMIVTTMMAAWLSRNTKIHNFAQTLIFTPHISSMVSVAILWTLMLDPVGIVNQVLLLFGIKGPNWLMDTRTSLISVALVTVWKSIGYYCLIIIAGLQSLPKDVYEAAKLDKASKWTIFRKITLPLLAPTLSFVFIMKFINSFKSFAAIDVMTQGGPQGSSMVLGYWIYYEGRVKFNYGFSMAGAVVMTIMVAGFVLLSQYLMKRNNQPRIRKIKKIKSKGEENAD